MIGDKQCGICKEVKPLDHFSLSGKYHHSYCRPCEVRYKAERRQADRRKAQFIKIRDRARAEGTEFSIDIEDFVIPEVCPVLGIPLTRLGSRNNLPSLDRIDPTKGYVNGNVLVVSFLANRIKNNATVDQLKSVYEFYAKLQQPSS